MRPDEAPAVFGAMRFLWLHDRAIQSVEDGTYREWGKALAEFSVDECTTALEGLAKTQDRAPTLAALLAELRAVKRRESPPVLDAPAEAVPTSRQKFRAESQRRADEYREQLIQERCRMEGQPSPERVAEIRAWAYEVGPPEAAYLRSQGVDAEVTQPKRRGGGLADAIEAGGLADPRGVDSNASADEAAGVPARPDAEPTPEPLTATEWAQRWRTATDETRPSLVADIRALPEEMRDEIRQLVTAQREGVA